MASQNMHMFEETTSNLDYCDENRPDLVYNPQEQDCLTVLSHSSHNQQENDLMQNIGHHLDILDHNMHTDRKLLGGNYDNLQSTCDTIKPGDIDLDQENSFCESDHALQSSVLDSKKDIEFSDFIGEEPDLSRNSQHPIDSSLLEAVLSQKKMLLFSSPEVQEIIKRMMPTKVKTDT